MKIMTATFRTEATTTALNPGQQDPGDICTNIKYLHLLHWHADLTSVDTPIISDINEETFFVHAHFMNTHAHFMNTHAHFMNVKPEREMQHHAPRGRRSAEA